MRHGGLSLKKWQKKGWEAGGYKATQGMCTETMLGRIG